MRQRWVGACKTRWEKWTARKRSLSVLAGLLSLSVVVYVVGSVAGDAWPDKWMPAFIATWVGLGVVVLILDEFRKQEERRRQTPVRRMAGASLRSALEGIVAFAMAHPPASLAEDPVEAAQFVRDVDARDFWLHAETQDADAARADWRTTLQETGTRLTTFLDECANYLEPEQRAQVGRLKNHALMVAGQMNPWSWPLGTSKEADLAVLAQVIRTWRLVVDPFCDVVDVYEVLTGSALTGTYTDFEAFYLESLPTGGEQGAVGTKGEEAGD